jgi:hypothetical protein
MAFRTCSPVVHRSESRAYIVDTLIIFLVESKSVARWLYESIILTPGAGILGQCRSVETRWSFGRGLLSNPSESLNRHAQQQHTNRDESMGH